MGASDRLLLIAAPATLLASADLLVKVAVPTEWERALLRQLRLDS